MGFLKSWVLGMAVSFFQALITGNPSAKLEAKKYAKPIYDSIKLAFAGDPDFD